MRAASVLRLSRSTSTRTGRPPASATTLALAAKVIAGTMTSSPGPHAGEPHRDLERGRWRG
jgi:hypothetical protein